jgi:DNA-binding NarL/FixJ family response regulator
MRQQLLMNAFHRQPKFTVNACDLDPDRVMGALAESRIDIALLGCDPFNRRGEDLVVAHHVHAQYPQVRQILLAENLDPNTVVNAFRAGVSGIFRLSDRTFRWLCKCVECVRRGEIWISNEHLQYLVDSINRVQSLRVVDSCGLNLLTAREEQVVALVADGLSNRDIAHELHLSEHTVKKYLFRIFEKVGVSSRVELVLYAVNHGATREAEWIPAAD